MLLVTNENMGLCLFMPELKHMSVPDENSKSEYFDRHRMTVQFWSFKTKLMMNPTWMLLSSPVGTVRLLGKEMVLQNMEIFQNLVHISMHGTSFSSILY